MNNKILNHNSNSPYKDPKESLRESIREILAESQVEAPVGVLSYASNDHFTNSL